MVDEFMVCVDRIIASAACVDSVNRRERLLTSGASVEDDHRHQTIVLNNVNSCNNGKSSLTSNKNSVGGEGCSSKTTSTTIRECRICQEEDEEHELEAPCACNGTLKFAHRKCIQRWCNKKGNITCEICNQVFSPNYTLPLARSNADAMSIDIRHGWGPHINLRDPHYLAFSTSEHQFLQSDYEDYAIANSGSLACFRSVAIILMLLLLIRQALMVSKDFGMVEESSQIFHFQISLLQLAGFLLPCYAMARSWFFLCRRRRQG